ncbi:MAG: hypothetical protein IJA13_03000, partial [Clostridia bacterium]|nr:hypothetical protein [Clostridia bacterium]
MTLPILKSSLKNTTVQGEFKGIDGVHITDMINLSCIGGCTTRKVRKVVAFLSQTPDQIMEATDCIYIRNGNTLKKLLVDSEGDIIPLDKVYPLKELSMPVNRKIIEFGGNTYVLPDNIQIGEDSWLPFAKADQLEVALPFYDERTLVYPELPNNSNFCSDALALKVGMQLKISSIPNEVFTVKIVELQTIVSEDGTNTVEARRIILDKAVPDYKYISTNTSVAYCDPENRPIFNELQVGFHHKISFQNNRIYLIPDEANYHLDFKDYFKIGQTVKIEGGSQGKNQKSAKITDIVDNCIYFDENFVTYTEDPKIEITITATMPRFDY